MNLGVALYNMVVIMCECFREQLSQRQITELNAEIVSVKRTREEEINVKKVLSS